MLLAENKESGLLTVDPDGSNQNTLRFGRMKYNGERGYYMPDCKLSLQDFATYPTKKEAIKAAKNLGFTARNVNRVGSRFWSCWGIRYDFKNEYFLAVFS